LAGTLLSEQPIQISGRLLPRQVQEKLRILFPNAPRPISVVNEEVIESVHPKVRIEPLEFDSLVLVKQRQQYCND
jgi:hypothetical protein